MFKFFVLYCYQKFSILSALLAHIKYCFKVYSRLHSKYLEDDNDKSATSFQQLVTVKGPAKRYRNNSRSTKKNLNFEV